ncbi:MAG: hypothetical protein COB50_05510 [Thiotrichales bacterium]|nr:MAG: hypothetical protein COB50_05510 [Thiotrichales bacterium]
MSAFKRSKDAVADKAMLEMLESIASNPKISQRSLSEELGIAFGLVNAYLRRCIDKGWVRAKAVSPKRYLYFVTPDGFVEKSRMVRNYLSRSFTFFRDARAQCEEAFADCQLYNWNNVALVGSGELAQIAQLVAHGNAIKVSVLPKDTNLQNFDAAIITDIATPQDTYDLAQNTMHEKKIITLKLLKIARNTPCRLL